MGANWALRRSTQAEPPAQLPAAPSDKAKEERKNYHPKRIIYGRPAERPLRLTSGGPSRVANEDLRSRYT